MAQLEDAQDTEWEEPSAGDGLRLGSIDEQAAEVESFLRDHPRD